MNPVTVRNIKIGEGIPKICVPIVGITEEEILNEAKSLANIPRDLVEWRVDWFESVFEAEKVKIVLEKVRSILGDTPLLFTFRTANEGGEKAISEAEYIAVNKLAIDSGVVDLVDVEIFSEENAVKKIIEYAHKNDVKVIASNHDFAKTPSKDEIIARLLKMQKIGADISKIAVMPTSKKDVLTLLSATEEMVTNHAKQPIVTMSMSGLGLVSRLAGEVFGSAITFGAAKKASAPGQISAKTLSEMLNVLHESL